MKHNEHPTPTETAAPNTSYTSDTSNSYTDYLDNAPAVDPVEEKSFGVEFAEPKPIEYGVQVTGANGAADRLILCESRDVARALVRNIRESRSAFEAVNDDLILSPTHIAYAEVVEQ